MSQENLKTNGPISGRLALENITADITLTAEDTGKIYLMDGIGEAVTIPAAVTANRGVHYTFVCNAACVTTDWTITSGAADIHLQIGSGGVNDADTITAGTVDTAITFVFDNADEGDFIRMFSTGTFWMVEGQANATANITAA